MIQFQKLKLSGFKSFVDHSELLITSGLTGVVGPNGCGKSNLVEALRWVMGETSAKQMRGGEMDDVIFAGSGTRPPRNVAEVAVLLDNTGRTAPALFNDDAELFVSRRIERSKGSSYKVNGRDVRARDVQLLFADAATGARSTAMVSQGKIGTIISAKPQNRRIILEEAAGITGLHSRRHEAEIRLRGAETNLERLEDILVTLETQQKNLEKQARQAARYKTISDRIRKAEALLFHMRWNNALDELEKARSAYQQADKRVTELTSRSVEASKAQAEAAAVLQPLREAEAMASAELQRLSIAREGLDAEEKRLDDIRQETLRRLQQVEADITREQDFSKDAETARARLEGERETLEMSREDEDIIREEALERLEIAKEDVATREEQVNRLTEEVAQADAKRNALQKQLNDLQNRLLRLKGQGDSLTRQKEILVDNRPDPNQLEEAQLTLEGSEEDLLIAEESIEEIEQRREDCRQQTQSALQEVRRCESQLTKLEAEEDALAELLDPKEGEDWVPILDSLSAAPGFEAALGAALGEDLNAPCDERAPLHWRDNPAIKADTPLPDGLPPLSNQVQGANALAPRLRQIGMLPDGADPSAYLPHLAQGQRLVSKDGGMWRWDGFVSLPGAPSAAAIRLKQKNRLNEIRSLWEQARQETDQWQAKLEQAQQAEERVQEEEKHLRDRIKTLNAQIAQLRKTLSDLQNRQNAYQEKVSRIDDDIARNQEEQQELVEEIAEQQEILLEIPEADEGRERLLLLREELADKRALLLDSQSAFDRLTRDAQDRQRRMEQISQELQSWSGRAERARHQLDELAERRELLIEELENHNARPEEISEQRQALMEGIERADAKRKACADKLAEADTHLRDVDGMMRQAEAELAQCREDRVRSESHVSQGKQLCMAIAERIRDRLDCKAEELAEIAEIQEGAEMPDLDTAEKRVDRLHRERDTMGPVNLRADTELTELTQQMETMISERTDLNKAIDKLRQAIAELNKEGRERLMTSFNEVNEHFQELFVRLFGGGRAHLELIEDDDPLAAGLEIMASPPGKRLQNLSLLSGGEQALTALALLFGVFLTNPAPICVLDEVDAPLDDANVDRFCTMLEQMAAAGSTRFLIITHHRMTMARMHRLFGVTMTERGVSQLVSVDLQKAEALVD